MTVLQFADNLTDRAAAHRVRYGMDLKYALGLELDDPGFDASVLSEFRTRLVEHGMEKVLNVPAGCPLSWMGRECRGLWSRPPRGAKTARVSASVASACRK